MTTPSTAMAISRHEAIPAFLSIDVEPAGFQLKSPEQGHQPDDHWSGYVAAQSFIESLRAGLLEVSGHCPNFGWYVRSDPQVEHVFGRADHILEANTGHLDFVRHLGDWVGVHMHPLRWCRKRSCWVHDFSDPQWLADCTSMSLQAYATWSGSPSRHLRAGAGFLSTEILEVAQQLGVIVELSLEPVMGWGLTRSWVRAGIDGTPMLGRHIDCRKAPRHPYHPSRTDFRLPDDHTGMNLVLIPLSTGDNVLPKPRWKGLARRILLASCPQEVFYPTAAWPSPTVFWDRIAAELECMATPYLSLAFRTDAADSLPMRRVRNLLQALPSHPLAQRLRFRDPLSCLGWLTPTTALAG